MSFRDAELKIERAAKHIGDLNGWLTSGDFYTLGVNKDADKRVWLTLDFDPTASPAALIIGDVLHNLRSALDIVWHAVIVACDGEPSKWSRFPIRDTVDELIAPLTNALEKNQVIKEVYDLILDTIKPYKTGNYSLWALDDLNIRDKHQLLLPILKIMHISGVSFEDESGKELPFENILIGDEPWTIRLREFYGKNIKIKNKGHAACTILFDVGFPFETQPVIPALSGIAKEVARTVKTFADIFTEC